MRSFKLAAGLGIVGSVAIMVAGCSGASTDSSTPQPVVISKSAQAAQEKQYAKESKQSLLQEFPKAKIPPTHVIRFISPTDYPTITAQCMTAAGFPASVTPDGGVSYQPVPRAQGEAQGVALYVCEVKYPIDARYLVPLDSQQISYLYNYYSKKLAVCLAKAGHPVRNIPSLQSFTDGINNGSNWTPYSSVGELPPSKWVALNKRCPQDPPSLYG